MGGIGGSLTSAWNSILNLLSKVVTPDWGSLIGMLPLLVFLAVGGALTLLALLWAWVFIRRPRVRTRQEEGPYAAPRDPATGTATYPRGLPHCRADALVYPPGSTRCDSCGRDLGVDCPMCGVARSAAVDRCGNCGLVLKIDPAARHRFARPAGPPPGGAAVA